MATSAKDKNNTTAEMAVNVDLTKNIPPNTSVKHSQLGELAIEASDIVSRLEHAVIDSGNPADDSSNPPPTPPYPNSVFLPLDRRQPEEILAELQTLLVSHEDGEQQQQHRGNQLSGGGAPLDGVGKLVLAAHSLAAYCGGGGVERGVLRRLSVRLTADVTRWLNQIFGYTDVAAFYHDDQLEGLVRVTRMMLHCKYSRYLDEGAIALQVAPPTIYTSVASPLGVVQHLCRQLGLPFTCVRPVPVNSHFGSQYTMDVTALERLLAEDRAAGRTPLLVLGDCGTPVTGHLDNIPRLRELCRANGAWLHIRGHNISALALPLHHHHPVNGSANTQTPIIADSFTLPLTSWLGIPGLPMVTMYHLSDSSAIISHPLPSLNPNPNPPTTPTQSSTIPPSYNTSSSTMASLVVTAGLSNSTSNDPHVTSGSRRLLPLPLWVALQSLGRDGFHVRVRDQFLASERLYAAVDCYRHVRVLSQKPGGENGTCTVSELISKPTNIGLLFETTASSVAFQFIPELEDDQILTAVPPYYDKLNSWLGQILQMEAPQLPIDICELENVGVVLRYSPFENSIGLQPNVEDMKLFVDCLEQQLVILRATVQHKETFIKLVDESPVLEIVHLPEWAGLGGVRYKPTSTFHLLEHTADTLNQLNIALVETLRTTDSAFSLGEGYTVVPDLHNNIALVVGSAEGVVTAPACCVRFGMLTPESDVEELLGLVVRVGQSVEERSRVLDSMSEIVKKGIETATLDLQKENEERRWQEGILRQVPVVGTFVNWWSPPTKETGVRGRSLNLKEGVVESTENIYKYHMQMQSGQQTGTKQPPTPQIQTSVGGGSQHSRSSSHASSQGGGGGNNTQQPVVVVNNLIKTPLDGGGSSSVVLGGNLVPQTTVIPAIVENSTSKVAEVSNVVVNGEQ